MLSQLMRVVEAPELRYTPTGTAVCNVKLAFDAGFGDKRETQWCEGTLWAKRAEKLQPMIEKGAKLFVCMDEVRVRSYVKRDGEAGASIEGNIVTLEFAGRREDGQSAPPPAQGGNRQQQEAPPPPAAIDPDDDDIPF